MSSSTGPVEPGGTLDVIDLSLQRFNTLTKALDARLQRKDEEQQQTLQGFGSRQLLGSSSAAWQPRPTPAAHLDPSTASRMVSVRAHGAPSATAEPGAAAPTQKGICTPANMSLTAAGCSQKTAKAGHPANRECSSGSRPATAHDGSTAWSSESGSCCLEWDSSLLELATEQSAPYSLLSEASSAVVDPQQKQAHATCVPAWRQQMQHEQQLELARQHQHAESAAATRRQLHASQQAAAWDTAKQQLPFRPTGSKVVGAKHTLPKSLSSMLRQAVAAATLVQHAATVATTKPVDVRPDDGAAEHQQPNPGPSSVQQESFAPAAAPCAAAGTQTMGTSSKQHAVIPLLDRYMSTAASQAAEAASQKQQAACVNSRSDQQDAASSVGDTLAAPNGLRSNCNNKASRGTAGTLPAAPNCSSVSGKIGALGAAFSSRPARKGCVSTRAASRAEEWAAADAATGAELACYLRDHWQQQYLPAAALILQCAWRSRGPRLQLNRYMAVRQRNVNASLGPALQCWQHWTVAGTYNRFRLQQQAFQAWRELVVLQLQLCHKVVRGLQRGVFSGEVANLLTWRMCTPLDSKHSAGVKPSLGGLLANLLKQREPRMRLQACFDAWLSRHQDLQATRARVISLLSAAALRWRRESGRKCMRFWHMYTVTVLCGRLAIALPLFRPRLPEFEEWLWHHERGKQLKRQATAMYDRSCLRRFFGGWRAHAYKVRTMRMAWSGLMLVTPPELIRHGISAFKANWKEQKLQRQLLEVCFSQWLEVSSRNKTVAIMRRRIREAAEHRCKYAALQAFKRHTNTSLLMTTAATIKMWQTRPLMLGHLHAWMSDSLHMLVYLLWWRWRRRAVARLRFRAALGLHMYRAHWLDLELAFIAWRKLTALGRLGTRTSSQISKQHQQTGAALSVIDDNLTSSGLETVGTTAAVAASDIRPPTSSATDEPLADADTVAAASTPGTAADVAAFAVADQSAAVNSLYTEQLQQQMEGGQGDGQEVQRRILVSLADFPIGLPWRPLARRSDVLASRGLQRLSGARLAKAVRDLRELEGMYIIKDHDRGAEGLLGSMVYGKRRAVSPGLKAMVNAELPMNLLWQATCQHDNFWWQRMVGLVQQHPPHPDSWDCFISSYNSNTCSNLRDGSTTSSEQLQASELHDLLHGSCCRVKLGAGASNNSSSCPVPSAVSQARLVRKSGFMVQPLQLAAEPSGATKPNNRTTNSVQAAGPNSSVTAPDIGTTRRVQILTSSHQDAADAVGGYASSDVIDSKYVDEDDCGWPTQWSAVDVAWLCQLVQAEELLETAVHMLLGIGADTSEELYQKLGVMTQGQGLDMQGDLLTWLLSTAMAHDTAHARGVLLKARARDELVVATMEMRQRAVALHLHFPWKFTLNHNGPVTDEQALWAGVMRRVEAERDWDASSVDSDDGSTGTWTAVMLQKLVATQAADPFALPGGDTEGGQAPGGTGQQPQYGQLFGCSGDALVRPGSPFFLSSRQGSPLPGAAPEASCGCASLNFAAASLAGSDLRASMLSPGSMLSQTMGSCDLQGGVGSRASTPAAAQHYQQHLEADMRMQEEVFKAQQLRRKQKAQQKQQQKQQAAIATAKGLFGQPAGSHSAAAAPTAGCSPLEGDTGLATDEVFTVPLYASFSGAPTGSAAVSRTGTPRLVALAHVTSSGNTAGAGAGTRRGSLPGLRQASIPGLVLQQQDKGVHGQEARQAQQKEPLEAQVVTDFMQIASPRAVDSPVAGPHIALHDSSSNSISSSGSISGIPYTTSRHNSRGTSSGSQRPLSSRHDRNTAGSSTGQALGVAMPAHSFAVPDDLDMAGAATSSPVRPSTGARSSFSIKEEVQNVLATVLGPAGFDDAGALEARQAAEGLAEVCAQWVVEHSWQVQPPLGMLEQEQPQLKARDSWRKGEVSSRDAGHGGDGESYTTAETVHDVQSAAGSPRQQQCPAVNCNKQLSIGAAGGLPPAGMSAASSCKDSQGRQPTPRPGMQPAISAKRVHGSVKSSESYCAEGPTLALGVSDCLMQSTPAECTRTGVAASNSPMGIAIEPAAAEDSYAAAALSAACSAGFTSVAASSVTLQQAAAVDASVTREPLPQKLGQAVGSAPASQRQKLAKKARGKQLRSQTTQHQQPQQPQTCCSQLQSNQQNQASLKKQMSSCSSTSSLPSIPSCSDILQQVMQQAERNTQPARQSVRLPSILPSSGGTQQFTQQQQQQQQQWPTGDQLQHTPDDTIAVDSSIEEAAWKRPVAVGPQQAVRRTNGGLFVADTPTLHSLLQDATKEDWQQFECLAQQLAAGFAAALQAKHAGPMKAVHSPAAAVDGVATQPIQQPSEQQAEAGDPPSIAAEADMWHSQPDVPAAVKPQSDVGHLGDGNDAASGAIGAGQQADMAGMLSKLMTAPLAARFVFWRQVAQQHVQSVVCSSPSGTDPRLASQLHQLAWSSLLQRPKAAKPQHQGKQLVMPAGPSATNMIVDRPACLQAKLRQYVQAHVHWRAQLASAAPLTPADKWISLEHEEQVLDFITGLTVSVYMGLLRKNTGMPTVGPEVDCKPRQVLAFGSSAPRSGSTTQSSMPSGTATAIRGVETNRKPSQAIKAQGQAVVIMKTVSTTQPRQRPHKPVPVFVVPAPAVPSPREAAISWRQQQREETADGVEALEGWDAGCSTGDVAATGSSFTGVDETADLVDLGTLQCGQRGAVRRAIAGVWCDGSGLTGPFSSSGSDASSWNG